MDVFYDVQDIPVHSCMMFEDRRSALDYPRRDLSLGFCRSCGFISNIKFDPRVHEYSRGYEEQQSFSPRFRAFQTELINRLIEQYDVRDKEVVEIGCGKGDFLTELCEAGGNRGVGIDPSCDPGRVNEKHAGRVRFVSDFYTEAYSDLPCDFLCCRHTLEHIHCTNDFIQRIRNVVGDRKDMVVFFEVPDISRVLSEQAFWDIYYEHCSYFSLGSLARVFRKNRFEVVELAKDYDGQYLLIVAKPVDAPTTSTLPAEEDLQETAREVKVFSERVGKRLDMWRAQLRACRTDHKRAVIWGSGSKCVAFLSALGMQDEIDAVVDINPHRHGKFLPGSGIKIAPPELLRDTRPDVIFVMNPIYCDEIQQQIDGMDITAELVPME